MDMHIDPDAKAKVELTKIARDANGLPFFIGKLQFPGTMEFDKGVSFMVFVSEEGVEELQIAPLDPSRRSKSHRDSSGFNGDRFSVELNPMVDRAGNTYYVGEARGFVDMDLRRGIFFTIFVSRPGSEELQISRLRPKHRYEVRDMPREEEGESTESPRDYKRGWSAQRAGSSS